MMSVMLPGTSRSMMKISIDMPISVTSINRSRRTIYAPTLGPPYPLRPCLAYLSSHTSS